MKFKLLIITIVVIFFSVGCFDSSIDSAKSSEDSTSTVSRNGCEQYTATNIQHVDQGRAEVYLLWNILKYTRTIGGGDELGALGSIWYSATTTVYKVSEGNFKKGECPIDLSTDANISELNLGIIAVSPQFDPEVTEYSATVAADVTSVEINVTVADTADYEIDGDINNVAFGDNIIKIVVTAEAGNTKTYTITVTRETNGLSVNANLSGITVMGVALTPEFSPDITSYSGTVSNLTEFVSISAVLADPTATMSIEPDHGEFLYVGANLFSIEVTAAAGNKKIYTVEITRQGQTEYIITDFADIGAASEGLVFDGKGYMYVTASNTGEIVKLDSSGTIVATVASGLNLPEAIDIDPDGNLWVAEYGSQYSYNSKVKKYTPEGVLLKTFTKTGAGYFDSIKGANGLAVSSKGNVYFSDAPAGKVVKIDKNDNVSVLFTDTTGNGPNGIAIREFDGSVTMYVVQLETANMIGTNVGYIHEVVLDYTTGDMLSKRVITPSISLPVLDGITVDNNGDLLVSYNKKDIARIDIETHNVEVLYEGNAIGDELSWPANIAFGKGPGFSSNYLYITQVGISVGENPTAENKKIKKMYVEYDVFE